MSWIWWLKNWRKFDRAYIRELCRQKFWGFIMVRFKGLYGWCKKYLKCDTLPF